MQDLEGKVILVTGAGSGIGRAIALAFAAQKSRVALTGRTQATLDGVAEEIRRTGVEALPRICDVTQKAQVEKLKQEISSRFGPVQVLVNNAGIAPAASFLEMQDSLWEEVMRVNLTGTYNCCKVFLTEMLASEMGPDRQHRFYSRQSCLCSHFRLCHIQTRGARSHPRSSCGDS